MPDESNAEELRSAEALRHASALISLFDASGAPLSANPAAYRAYGEGANDLAARFVDAADGPAILAEAKGAAVSGLYAVLTQAGRRWHHIDARPLLDPVTGLPCVLLNEQDVTPRVEAEIARGAAEQKAAMAEARRRFLTDMSHELRTPLNAVIGFSRLLADAGLPDEATGQARRIYDAGLTLLDVVDQMIAGPTSEGAAPSEAPSALGVEHRTPAPDAGADRAALPDRRLRALYVDDNESNRILVRAMLSTMGIDCETACDGGEGVEAAANGDWDVILMDIQMPTMDGVTASRRIRALQGQVAATPIIAVTANTLDEQIEAYVEAGMDDCVAKPVDMVELLTKTSHWGGSGWREAVAASEALAD